MPLDRFKVKGMLMNRSLGRPERSSFKEFGTSTLINSIVLLQVVTKHTMLCLSCVCRLAFVNIQYIHTEICNYMK